MYLYLFRKKKPKKKYVMRDFNTDTTYRCITRHEYINNIIDNDNTQ